MRKKNPIERLRGLVRLGAFTTCVFLGLAGLAARSAYSDAREASMIVGREFAGLGELVNQGHRVRLNGEEIHVGSTIVDLPTSEVLDRFEALCRKGTQGLEDAVKDPAHHLPEAEKKVIEGLGLVGLGILRNESHGEGTVACVTRSGSGGFDAAAQRVLAFSQSLDLNDLGKLRYVYTRPTANKGKSQVITVWSEGKLRLDRVFVAGAEAPGSDPVGAPRPPESIRVLSAEIQGAPYGIHIYESAQPAQSVLKFYDDQLKTTGWAPVDEVPKASGEARAYSREGAELMLFVEAGPRTAVSLVELPAKVR